jgi:hypothetical protein
LQAVNEGKMKLICPIHIHLQANDKPRCSDNKPYG